jgi:HEAT repeat protein
MPDAAARVVGVLTVDRELTVALWDPWVAGATGIAAERAVGTPLTALVPTLEERHLLARIRRVIEDGVVQVLAPAFHHYLIPCPPRQPSRHFHLMQQHVTITPWRRDGAIVGAVISIEDVTARLDRERELAADLRSADEAIRLRATQELAAAEAGPAALVDAFADASWRVRRAAVTAVAERSGEEVVAALTAALEAQNRDFSVLNATLSALALSGEDVLPGLLELFGSDDPGVRVYVALVLGQLGSTRAVPPLLDALGDPDENVRFHAIEALGRLRARSAAPQIAAIAAAADFYLAFAALDALAAIGDGTVAPALVPLLDRPELAAAAADALGRIGDEDVVGVLAARLSAAAAPVAAIAGALALLHRRFVAAYDEGALIADLARTALDPEAARRLVGELPSADEAALPDLVLVLSWVDHAGVIDALTALLAHRGVRPYVVDTLVRHGRAAVPALVAQLDGEDLETRQAAAAALGRIGSPEAVPPLLAALADAPGLAVVAAAALGAIGERSAFGPLLELLAHPDAGVRHAAIAALNSLGHPELPDRVAELLEAPEPHVREAAARIAGYFGYAHCAGALLRMCDDPDERVRRAALENIVFCAPELAADALADALAGGGVQVRAAAAQAAAHLGGPAAVALVGSALDDSDPWVRYCAARAAAQLDTTRLASRLTRLAADGAAPHVRVASIDALGRTGSEGAAAALAPLAQEPDMEIARAALRALARLPFPSARGALRAALASGDGERCRAALAALSDGTAADDVIGDVESLVRNARDRQLALDGVRVLGRVGTPAAVDALLRLAEDPLLRADCTSALAQVREDQLHALGRGLQAEAADVRCAVVEALARRKHPDASRLIASALEDRFAEVRLAAAHALRRMDVRAAEQELAAAASRDEDGAVRQAAQKALVRP